MSTPTATAAATPPPQPPAPRRRAGGAAGTSALPTGVAAMIETALLEGAAATYAKMMAGKARFRMVLTMDRSDRAR